MAAATHPPPSPAATIPEPPATNPPDGRRLGKGPASLSLDAIPFYPSSTPGRSKAMRWSSESDLSDDDSDVELVHILQGSAGPSGAPRAAMEAGSTSQPHCPVEPPPARATTPDKIQIQGAPKRKRGKRKRESRRQARLERQQEGSAPPDPRVLGERKQQETRAPPNPRAHGGRTSVHERLGGTSN